MVSLTTWSFPIRLNSCLKEMSFEKAKKSNGKNILNQELLMEKKAISLPLGKTQVERKIDLQCYKSRTPTLKSSKTKSTCKKN